VHAQAALGRSSKNTTFAWYPTHGELCSTALLIAPSPVKRLGDCTSHAFCRHSDWSSRRLLGKARESGRGGVGLFLTMGKALPERKNVPQNDVACTAQFAPKQAWGAKEATRHAAVLPRECNLPFTRCARVHDECS
jgi:hypothetical protein